MKHAILFLFLVINLSAFCQPKNVDAVLGSLKRKYAGIRDYTVDARIVVDVWFLNMPEKKAKLFYKYPDKVHVETKGFALLPKRAASFDPGALIGDKYTAIFVNSEIWGNSVIDVIKTIPNEANSDVILSTYWIDEKMLEVRKLEIDSKSGGAFSVELFYNNLPFDLPKRLTVAFDVKEMNMPKTFTGEIPKKDKSGDGKEGKKGKVTIFYSNYRVNTGLNDKLFIEKK